MGKYWGTKAIQSCYAYVQIRHNEPNIHTHTNTRIYIHINYKVPIKIITMIEKRM